MLCVLLLLSACAIPNLQSHAFLDGYQGSDPAVAYQGVTNTGGQICRFLERFMFNPWLPLFLITILMVKHMMMQRVPMFNHLPQLTGQPMLSTSANLQGISMTMLGINNYAASEAYYKHEPICQDRVNSYVLSGVSSKCFRGSTELAMVFLCHVQML